MSMLIDADTVLYMVVDQADLVNPAHMEAIFATFEQAIAAGGPARHNLSFHGYERDAREVWEIPECVDVCHRVLAECPGLLKVLDEGSRAVLLFATARRAPVLGWKVNPAWRTVLGDDCDRIQLGRP